MKFTIFVPVVVVNHFIKDTDAEINVIKNFVSNKGSSFFKHWAQVQKVLFL